MCDFLLNADEIVLLFMPKAYALGMSDLLALEGSFLCLKVVLPLPAKHLSLLITGLQAREKILKCDLGLDRNNLYLLNILRVGRK